MIRRPSKYQVTKTERRIDDLNDFTALDDFKVDSRLNQFTKSLVLKTNVSTRLVYWSQSNRCVSALVEHHLRQQIERAYGITSAFIQSWNDVIQLAMVDTTGSISEDPLINMMVLVEGEREVAAAKQVCDGLIAVYKECVSTYQTYQAARVMIMSERSTAKLFLEEAKISKSQCELITTACNKAYIRLLNNRPVGSVLPSIHDLLQPTSEPATRGRFDFVSIIQQVDQKNRDLVCDIIQQNAQLIPLGRNQFLKGTNLMKNTHDVNLPFHGASFCFVARGTILATQIHGQIFHKKETCRELLFLSTVFRRGPRYNHLFNTPLKIYTNPLCKCTYSSGNYQ